MATLTKPKQRKKPYAAPSLVEFGDIEAMTGDCFGVCLDGMNGGLFWGP